MKERYHKASLLFCVNKYFYYTTLGIATVMTTYHYGCRNPISLIMSFTTLSFTLEASLLS